jgi:predicted dehydrogenase/threonine dehydrogenase-like Zn-dependent dehydrogenase
LPEVDTLRQLLLTNGGVKVARMPAPALDAGCVLVRVNYSMVSVGTEVATLRPTPGAENAGAIERARAATGLARRYLGAAIANPKLAVRRSGEIVRDQLVRLVPRRPIAVRPDQTLDDVTWARDNATRFEARDRKLSLQTDDSEWHYQARSSLLRVLPGYVVALDLRGSLDRGQLSIGMLDEAGSRWLGTSILPSGTLEDRLVFDPQGESAVRLVVANAQGGVTRLALEEWSVALVAPDPDGVAQNEMDASGWNLGYSGAGVVVKIGAGVTDLAPGDRVACAGAGRANHADFVTVPRNLVCRVPEGCDLQVAATTTVGTIALQGVRRAGVTLGETICVVGLGLLGQITAQLLRASGCTVVGMDLDQRRVERAKRGGMAHGASSPEALQKLVRDLTQGRGVDRTLMVAATKSDTVINMAMEITRRRGTVVIVGDVGLNVQRPQFYRKEIDLLMSTSYGPGRYDVDYEEKGIDYPFAYVRWTLNRNMQSYLELAAQGRLDIASLIDEVVPIEQAPDLYRRLATASDAPLGVLLSYPEPALAPPQPLEATRVALRGHRKVQDGPQNTVLVGAGAFGQAMLVPMMERRRDRFFLRGVVSRDTVRGGNFARERRLDILATELQPVLDDDSVDLLVISTRHIDHARQVVAGLKAGKNVFVEKPLAVNWDELTQVAETYEGLPDKPQLMVGFNRRFSPAMQALSAALKARRSPLLVNYRLNGGYIPMDHWVQTAEGAGRNIGEACHMYDVFRFLAGSPVTAIHAQSINPADLPYQRNDNFCATLGYGDGSLCNLVYTALGPKKGLAKERVEVFCDGEAYVMDDYLSLTRASDGEVLWKADAADKGHAEEISRWGDLLAGQGKTLIPFEEIIETTAVALHVEDLLFGRVEAP